MKISFIEDCKAIITEGSFSSRWAEIEKWHELGKAICEEKDFTLKDISILSENIDIDEQEILMAIIFYKKFPDLSMIPEGKNISWNKIIEDYL